MAFTQTQIDNLESALASGFLEVEYQGKRVRYQSLADMRRVLADMKAAAANNKPRYADTIYQRD